MNDLLKEAHKHYPKTVPTRIIPPTHTVSDVFEAAVHDFPQNIAIDFLGREFTYKELYEQIKRAASVLSMCGVRRGDAVSLMLPNCPQHYVAFYALSYLGAVVSEHNPLAPPAQLKEQLERISPRVVVAWEQTAEKLAKAGVLRPYTCLAVDITRALPRKSQFLLKLPIKAAKKQRAKMRGKVPPEAYSWDDRVAAAYPMHFHPEMHSGQDDIAVLIQTGGTTGTPKAVALTHRNIVSNAAQVLLWLDSFKRGKETVGAVLPFFHAFGLQLSLSVCVCLAATQVMLPAFDPELLLAGNSRHPITFLCGVAPMFRRILKVAHEKQISSLPSIRFSVSGAMPLPRELAEEWEKFTGGFLIEGYGMSECSPVLCASPLNANRRPSTLGVPLPSTEIRIADPENPDLDVAPGEVGELLVRGPQVFPGYFNDPKETKLCFHNGWLRTGDLVTCSDGFIVMADRRKEMIINGGFNVYPSEVEQAIRDMDGVEDVAVVGMPNGSLGEMVVAALVLKPGAAVDLDAVRKWSESKLSHYAMPKAIAILDDLPRSQLGKVMRRNVRDQLQNFQLISGELRQKLSEASSNAAEILDSYLQTLREKTNSSAEDWKEWLENNNATLEGFKNWLTEQVKRNTEVKKEEVEKEAAHHGFSTDTFFEWLRNKTGKAGCTGSREEQK